ncbi:hypothetical protein DB347_22615 [Opitutaceae bacterium EW11]|nr:hypothetical protein DB347_22615 [Opitutaceae bacterium EW11]
MKRIESQVILAVVLSMACVVTAFAFAQAGRGLTIVAQVFMYAGMLAVGVQAFRWGAYNGYRIRGQAVDVQCESILRCAAMAFVMFFWSLLGSALVVVVFNAIGSWT